jgi:hypothetical protein
MRSRFQGTINILRFNWHYYLISPAVIFGLIMTHIYLGNINYVIAFLVLAASIVSVLASYFIYDWSDLYQFNWINPATEKLDILNIHAGFDETSEIIVSKFAQS